MRHVTWLALLLGSLGAFEARAAGEPNFVDGWTYFDAAAPASFSSLAFEKAKRALASQFEAVCGDTFCSGPFSNLTSLGLDCSFHAASGQVGECVWTFAGSSAKVAPDTGRIAIHKRIFECAIGIQGSANEVIEFFNAASDPGSSGSDGLRNVPVPGTGVDLMATLRRCL